MNDVILDILLHKCKSTQQQKYSTKIKTKVIIKFKLLMQFLFFNYYTPTHYTLLKIFTAE